MHRQDPIPRHGWLKRCTYELGELAVRYEATVHGQCPELPIRFIFVAVNILVRGPRVAR
jgi:hypothetical protein